MLVLVESFDHFSAGNVNLKGWGVFGGSGGVIQRPGRWLYGAQSHSLEIFTSASKSFSPSITEFVTGFGFFTPDPMDSMTFFDLSNKAKISISSAGRLSINVTGGGTTSGSGSRVLNPGKWYYPELKVTTTTAELRLDGVTEISVGGTYSNSYSTVNLTNPLLLGNNWRIDDLYVCDLTGGFNDDFLDDVAMVTMYPISDGAHTDWTPDTGTAHYSRVNELQFDGDASYVHSNSAGDEDSYAIGNPTLPTIASVKGAQLNLAARKDDAGTRTIKPLVRQAGADYLGPATALTSDYIVTSWLLDQDPTGSDWTGTTIDADEFGIKLEV